MSDEIVKAEETTEEPTGDAQSPEYAERLVLTLGLDGKLEMIVGSTRYPTHRRMLQEALERLTENMTLDAVKGMLLRMAREKAAGVTGASPVDRARLKL